MSIGFWQIAIVVILVVLLFGRGKISSLMGDVAKGIKSFKKGMSSDENNQTNLEDKKDEDSNSQNKKFRKRSMATSSNYNLYEWDAKSTSIKLYGCGHVVF